MKRRFCGKDWDEMNDILDILCDLEDRMELTGAEENAFEVAIQCVATVLNRLKEDRPINWD